MSRSIRLLIFICMMALSATAWAQVPAQMSYEGRLLSASGATVQGMKQFHFALWPAATGGTAPLWSDTYSVAVTDGLYSIQLGGDANVDGGTSPLPLSIFDGSTLYLEIAVNGETLSPRQRVTSVAYAMKAGNATNATNVSGGTVNASSVSVGGNTVIDSSGNVTANSVSVNGTPVIDNTGHLTGAVAANFCPASGSVNYIQNRTGPQSASFNVSGTGVVGGMTVNGSLIIADGTQGAGKLLVSDPNGLASWGTPPPLGSSWVIFERAGTTFAVNGTTGTIDFQGSDATAVLQSAINTLTTGGRILLRDGTYVLHGSNAAPAPCTGSTYSLFVASNVEIQGEHRDGVVLKGTSGENSNIVLACGQSHIILRNLTLDTGGNRGYGISLFYTDESLVEDVRVIDSGTIPANTMLAETGTRNKLARVIVDGSNSSGVPPNLGFELGSPDVGTEVLDCIARHCQYGLKLDEDTPTTGGFNQDVRVKGGEYYANTNSGLVFSDVVGGVIDGASIHDNGVFGVAINWYGLTSDRIHTIISNSEIYKNGDGTSDKAGVQLAGRGSMISSSHIYDNNPNAIALNGTNLLVTGSVLYDDQATPTQLWAFDVSSGAVARGQAIGNSIGVGTTNWIHGGGQWAGWQTAANDGYNTINCPNGYTQDTSVTTFALCKKTLAGSQIDEMVKVGDFWIDRYEVSMCSGALGTGPGQDTTAVACSASGLTPQASITQFQALAMCVNAGKHLCSNAEWQAAVSGTPDPGSSDGTGGTCVTSAGGPRITGGGTNCRSRFGAEDMIGNVWEWVDDWQQAGMTWQTSDGQTQTPWPAGYGSDETWNVNGRAYSITGWQSGVPAAALRGGSWIDGTGAGVFALFLDAAPSNTYVSFGARCCAGH